ncbi:glypican-5a [Hypomesus transpacificus]|uniref:glypican-5a n=1 Tax=Hypomesus transpacificus TaxID=137520 RepID=UPI001F07A50C|nr:glypican-5a [Hypomesus transpacificus]
MGLQELICFLILFFACFVGLSLENPTNCDEVRKVFQLRQIGPVNSLPESPRTGVDLQVCMSKNLTCCTKKMEERYQVAARRDIQNLLQTSSSSLKFLISRNVAAFQETFEGLMKQTENHTNTLLLESYRNMAAEASAPVGELLTDVGLFILGSELSVDDLVQRFFDALFPLVYNHLINPGLSAIAPGYAECVRSSRRDLVPFGEVPSLLANQIGRSGVQGRLLLQALHLGIEVINTTDHLTFTRECRRALLRMQFCPHCQGLTQSKPCMGYCLNVVRGCLASMAEVDPHWREFVRSLEGLSSRMHGNQDIEQVLLGVHTLVHDAVAHAQKNGPRLSAQVHKVCGHPNRRPAQSVSVQQGGARESIPLKAPLREAVDSLATRRKEFLNSLRLYRTFYGGLADQLCVSELASADGHSCWNGADVVKSYTLRVVGNGIKAQTANPEVKVKGADPVINQIIDKLKHINQLLQGKSIPKYGTLDQIETGSGDAEGRSSGDCDDEDGCGGSGSSEGRRNVLRVSKLSPDSVDDHRRSRPQGEDLETGSSSASSSHRRMTATGVLLALILTSLLTLLSL